MTAEQVGQYTSDAVSGCDKNDRPDGHMKIATGEDAKVEHEDGAFGKSSGCTVNYGGDEVQLSEFPY
jgi:hypothetical protein